MVMMLSMMRRMKTAMMIITLKIAGGEIDVGRASIPPPWGGGKHERGASD